MFNRLLAPILSIILSVMAVASQAAETSPFATACKDPGSLSLRPKTGILKMNYPTQDSKGLRSAGFLASVLELGIAKIDKDLTFTANLQTCMGELKGDPRCKDMEDFVNTHLPALIKDARFHLLVSQSPQDFNSTFENTDNVPNYRMRDWGIAKIRAWDAPTKAEYALAKKTLNSYEIEIIAHYLKAWNQSEYRATYGERKMVKQSLLATRLKHFQQYKSFFAAAPFLQYFSEAQPTPNDIKRHFEEFEINANKEREYLEGLVENLRSSDNVSLGDSVTAALQYSSYVELMLTEKPEYCGLMTSLMYTQFNRSLALGLGVGLPLVVTSFVAPGIVAYPLGILASSYFAYDAYNNHFLVKARAQSVLFLDPGDNANESLVEAQGSLSAEMLLFPLSMIGGRTMITSFRAIVAGKAVQTTALRGMVYLPKNMFATIEKFSSKIISR